MISTFEIVGRPDVAIEDLLQTASALLPSFRRR
jgi:hypothetical protein